MSKSVMVVRTNSGNIHVSTPVETDEAIAAVKGFGESTSFWFVNEDGVFVNFQTRSVESCAVQKITEPFWKKWQNKEKK